MRQNALTNGFGHVKPGRLHEIGFLAHMNRLLKIYIFIGKADIYIYRRRDRNVLPPLVHSAVVAVSGAEPIWSQAPGGRGLLSTSLARCLWYLCVNLLRLTCLLACIISPLHLSLVLFLGFFSLLYFTSLVSSNNSIVFSSFSEIYWLRRRKLRVFSVDF